MAFEWDTLHDVANDLGEPDVRAMLTFFFDQQWERLASAGLADEKDGKEYRRTKDEWFCYGCPINVLVFMQRLSEDLEERIIASE